jgi:hypothetical protein
MSSTNPLNPLQQSSASQQTTSFSQNNGLLGTVAAAAAANSAAAAAANGLMVNPVHNFVGHHAHTNATPPSLHVGGYGSPIENLSVFFNQHHNHHNPTGFGGFASKLSELQQAYQHPYTSLVTSMISGLAGNPAAAAVVANSNQQTASVVSNGVNSKLIY